MSSALVEVTTFEEGLTEDQLNTLLEWVDSVPVTRPKKNFARDFSDGVLAAEIIAFYVPKLVDVHNYYQTSSADKKKINWDTLNRKALSKLKMKIADSAIKQIIEAKSGAAEKMMWEIRKKIIELQPASAANTGREMPVGSKSRARSTCSVTSNQSGKATASSVRARTPARAPSRLVATSAATSSTIQPVKGSKPILPQLNVTDNAPATGKDSPSPAVAISETSAGKQQQPVQSSAPPQDGSVIIDANNNEEKVAPIPGELTYRGHKMVPYIFLEKLQKEFNTAAKRNEELKQRAVQMKGVVEMKEARIRELAMQLHQTRAELLDLQDSIAANQTPSSHQTSATAAAAAPSPSKPRRHAFEDF